MTKKQISKKKVSLKLTHGETAVVLDFDTFMHIAETYDFLATQESAEYKDWYYGIADIIRYQAGANCFQEDEDEEYEW